MHRSCRPTVESVQPAIRIEPSAKQRLAASRTPAASSASASGTVTTPIDAAGLPLLTQALLDGGFDEAEIRAVMGGNVLGVLAQVLPEH